jgi:hypothetical protein
MIIEIVCMATKKRPAHQNGHSIEVLLSLSLSLFLMQLPINGLVARLNVITGTATTFAIFVHIRPKLIFHLLLFSALLILSCIISHSAIRLQSTRLPLVSTIARSLHSISELRFCLMQTLSCLLPLTSDRFGLLLPLHNTS